LLWTANKINTCKSFTDNRKKEPTWDKDFTINVKLPLTKNLQVNSYSFWIYKFVSHLGACGGCIQVSVYFVSFFLAFFFFWQKYINEQIPIAYLSKKNYNANLNSHSKSKHGYPIQVSEFTQHIICSSYEERNTRNWTGMRGNPTLKGIKLMVQGLELFDWDLIF
jgi:hypothetical protein